MNLKLKAVEISRLEKGTSTWETRYVDTEKQMPKLKIACITDDSQEVIVGYMTPFRGYRFQVSATLDGQIDLGSSEVVGLANLKIADWGITTSTALTTSNCNLRELTKEIMKGLMLDAVSSFMEYPYHMNMNIPAVNKDFVLPEGEEYIITGLKDFKNSETFKNYIEAVYEYLWS